MTEPRDPLIGQMLEPWQMLGETPAWEDVLSRAGIAQRTRRAKRPGRRLETSKRFYAAVAVAGVIAVAAPAFALVAHRLLNARPIPGTMSTTHVEIGSGRSADLRLRSRGSPLERDAAGLRFVGPGTDRTRFFRWTLELHGVDRVARAQLDVEGQLIRLCSPCRAGSGLFSLRDGGALALLNGRATLALGDTERRVAPAAGGRLPRKPSG